MGMNMREANRVGVHIVLQRLVTGLLLVVISIVSASIVTYYPPVQFKS